MNLNQLFCNHDYSINEFDWDFDNVTCSKCGKEIPKRTIKTCRYCYYRHRCKWEHKYYGCQHWRLGKCNVCKGLSVSDQEWYKHECETYCLGGCKKYFKRDWKATFRWWFKREIRRD